MIEHLKEIIDLGIQAPSGENCQPWQFVISDDQLEIFNLPERDQSLYSWGQRASLFAHGALIENLSIASEFYGWAARITPLPDPSDENHIATVRFQSIPARTDPLFDSIKTRISNRKPYDKSALSASDLEKLLAASQGSQSVSLEFADDPKIKAELGYLAALNEKVIFENYDQHQFFFNHINWTPAEDQRKSIGFYIETLELPPPAKVMFKLVRHWGAMRVMNVLKFGNLVAKGNGQVNSAASAFGAIKVANLEKLTTIEAGRVLERVWLTATSLGLQVQPLTGILFLELMIRSGNVKPFSPAHLKLISSAYQKIAAAFHTKPDEFVLFMFRIGRGAPATAHSSRLPAQIEEKK